MPGRKKQRESQINELNIIYIILLFSIIGFLIYSNTFSVPFILDDYRNITENDAIKRNEVFSDINVHRYIGNITFALNYKMNGFNPAGYHFINILIHIINAVLVYIVVRKIMVLIAKKGEGRDISLFALITALLFLVHPIQTQAVTYIVQRYTSLAAMFSLIAILAYIKFRTAPSRQYLYYGISLASTLLAIKSKENTATLPLMIAAIELIFFKYKLPSIAKKMILLLPFFIVLAAIPLSFMNFDAQDRSMSEVLREFQETSYETKLITRTQYLLTEFRVIITYLRMLVLPYHQSLHHLYPVSYSLFETGTFFSFLFIVAIIVGALLTAKNHFDIAFGALWFFLFLLVESSVIPIQDVIFEHRLYLPSIGFFTACVGGLFYLMNRCNRKVIIILIIGVVITFSVLTYMRNMTWKDEVTIWKDVAKKYPGNVVAHASIGAAYAKLERCDEAVEELKRALEIDSNFEKAHNNLAVCYFKKGLMEEAAEEYRNTIRLNPHNIKAYYNLGSLYYNTGKIKDALAILLIAETMDGKNAMVNAQIGNIYCLAGEFESAYPYLHKAIEFDPANSFIQNNFGICLLRNGKTAEARELFLNFLKKDPDSYDSYFHLASAYDAEGDYRNAISYYRIFISKPGSNNALLEAAKSRLMELEKIF
ncbi:MAG: hypothetical protein A2Y62_07830 [Candidatus Fischerbacteria bacterium RBG_13_37_8]|uniref:Uncharacterized protein n=1 Tax=Candidatus Fischerbacteria bacterium RBG_13_37_8 TaxID=1817863 RepID=A0A1F5V937_9BACT|nr:MAG: hypothetical protein A2Y62_07830 [Candidatus Fischerbacteria bacterium RBG_13_37_8]